MRRIEPWAFVALLILGALYEPSVSHSQEPSLPDLQCGLTAPDGTCSLYSVSLITLLANPQVFDGKRVRLVGFVNLEREGNAVYFHREDYEQGITENALWLSISPQQALIATKPGYFLLEGTFIARDHGHFGLFAGAIRDIDRIQRSLSRAEMRKRADHEALGSDDKPQ